MQDNPFGHIPVAQPQQAPAQQPATIGGRRVIGGIAPAERRAEEDQALERQKFQNQQAIEAERLRLSQQAEARASEQAERGGVEQGKAASFLRRAINAETNFRGLGDVQPRSLPGQAVKESLPNVSNLISDSDRQRADQAEREFIAAILRYDSGAAIPDSEFVSTGQIYFPRPGDTPEQLAQKAQSRRVAIEGLLSASGPEGQRIGLPDFEAMSPRKAKREDEAPLGFQTGFDTMGQDDPFDRSRYLQERFGVDPGSETRLVGMLNANNGNPNVSPDMVLRMYADAGVPPPAEQDLAQLVDDMRSGKFAPTTAIDTSEAEKRYLQGLDTALEQQGIDPDSAAQSALFGTARGLSLGLSDELTGVTNAIVEGLQGQNPITAYQVNRDLTRRMADRSQEESPVSAYGSEIAGGLLTGGVGASGRVNSLREAARVGAIQGGIAGFGYGEGAGGSALGAAVGAPTGALLGTGFQAAGNKIQNALASRRTPVDPAQVQSVVDAGERRGVTVRRPDVDPNIRNQRAAVQQTEQGRSAIAAADQNDIAEIETALIRDLGGQQGATRTGAATGVQQGVKAARDGLRRQAQVAYRAAAAQAGNVTAPPTNAVAQIDQQIAELAANGRNLNAKELTYLEGLKADLTQGGGLSVDGLRAQRTGLRQRLENAGVYSSDFERRIGIIMDDASKDMEAAMQSFPQALTRYREGDKLWRQQADFGKQVGDQLIGKDGNLGPGQAADRLMGWAKKDPARLSRLMQEADAGTQDEVRALVASQLGRAANGNFSLAAFLTQTSGGRGGSLSPAAIRSLFGKDGAKAIDDLRILSQAKVDAASATNRSNTGSLVQKGRNGLRRLILGGFGFSAAADAGGGMGLATLAAGGATVGGEIVDRLGRERAIRLLLNPDFTGWLRRLPNTSNPQAINRSLQGLRSVAARSPVMLTDVQTLERALVSVANDNTSRIAAEPSDTSEPRQMPE